MSIYYHYNTYIVNTILILISMLLLFVKGYGVSMLQVPIRWKVKSILESKDVTPYRFWKDTKLSSKVAYAIANDEHDSVDLKILEKVIPYLRSLTGRNIQIGDVVEYV